MNAEQNAFLTMAVPAAQASQAATGVPASVTIAQAILESGWGRSSLARTAFNYFGIKAAHFAAPNHYIELPTHEVVHGVTVTEEARFARFADVTEGFKAHGLLLAQSARYAPAMDVRHDAAQFAAALQKCGYSTNPNYGALLSKLIHDYDLAQYDAPPEDCPAKAQAAA